VTLIFNAKPLQERTPPLPNAMLTCRAGCKDFQSCRKEHAGPVNCIRLFGLSIYDVPFLDPSSNHSEGLPKGCQSIPEGPHWPSYHLCQSWSSIPCAKQSIRLGLHETAAISIIS